MAFFNSTTMTTTYQLTLTLPGTEADGQLDIFAVLELLPADLAGYAAEWSTPARDITTWQGMAEELAERLLDFEALTLPAQGSMIGAALAHTYDNGQTLDDYLAGMIAVTGRNAFAIASAWGVEQ